MVGIFQARRGDEVHHGTAYDLAEITGCNPHDIRAHARAGEHSRTRSGWSFVCITRGGGMLPPHTAETIFVATNPREDPIVGPAEEIAALTGMSEGRVFRIWASGHASRDGWTIRRASE